MKYTAPIIIVFLILTSCSDAINRPIKIETAVEDVAAIKETIPDSDTLKTKFLNFIHSVSKGRLELVNFMLKQDPDLGENANGIVIQEPKFTDTRDGLFKYFGDKNATYAMVFDELDTLQQHLATVQIKINELNKNIDSRCLELQNMVSSKIEENERFADSINAMVRLELLNINPLEACDMDVIEVKIKMTNLTDKKIEALMFSMMLKDKLGKSVGVLQCSTNDGFQNEEIGFWQYSKWDQRELYKALENLKAEYLTEENQVLILNLDGNIIDFHNSYLERPTNYDYKSPTPLDGKCLYLEKDDPLVIQFQAYDSESLAGLARAPIYQGSLDYRMKFLDFQGLNEKLMN